MPETLTLQSVLLSSHTCLETAFLQDWPYGRRRCVRAIWIETTKHGQRACFATTNLYGTGLYENYPGTVKERLAAFATQGQRRVVCFNKPKKGTYSPMLIYCHGVNEEGQDRTWCEVVFTHSLRAALAWRESFRQYLDEEQLTLLEGLIKGD